MILTCIKSHYADEDDNDESDKIPNHHLRFCPLGFIPHTQILFCANNRHLHFKEDWSLVSSSKTTATTSVSTEALCFKYEWSVENGERGSFDLLGLRTASRSAPATKAGRWYFPPYSGHLTSPAVAGPQGHLPLAAGPGLGTHHPLKHERGERGGFGRTGEGGSATKLPKDPKRPRLQLLPSVKV